MNFDDRVFAPEIQVEKLGTSRYPVNEAHIKTAVISEKLYAKILGDSDDPVQSISCSGNIECSFITAANIAEFHNDLVRLKTQMRVLTGSDDISQKTKRAIKTALEA